MKLTDRDIANLNWMIRCNADRIGFLGPSVRRQGSIAELQHLVDAGLARIVPPAGRGDAGGYWITEAGRRALVDGGRDG